MEWLVTCECTDCSCSEDVEVTDDSEDALYVCDNCLFGEHNEFDDIDD